MPVPTRTALGAKTVTAVNPNLFVVAEQYLGDATQWERIADLNSDPSVPPDFLVDGAVTLQIPAKAPDSGAAAIRPTVEQILFGASA